MSAWSQSWLHFFVLLPPPKNFCITPCQLYSTYTDTYTSLLNTVTNFFDFNKTQLVETEWIVTKKSNSPVHQLHFSSLHQYETEPIQDFVVHLKSIAPDCKFTCLNCQHDIQEQQIKDQLIRGLFNETLYDSGTYVQRQHWKSRLLLLTCIFQQYHNTKLLAPSLT